MKKKVLLKDVAEKAGVSVTLVSYVLNNRLKDRISKETAEKIRRVATEMNYRPNQIAKSLKNNKSQTIGLIVSDIANPFSSSIARVIEDEADKNNFTVIFGSADESSEKAKRLTNVLLSRQVDGFIIAPPEGFEPQLSMLKKEDVPFVLIDRYFKDFGGNYITIDNYKASYNAVKHLINNGFENIGFINYKNGLEHLHERTRGYYDAISSARSKVNAHHIKEIDESRLKKDITIAIDELLRQEKPIDALFFSSSNVAIEGLSYLRENKITVPDKLGVVCFDETKAYDLFPVPVTYIRQPLIEMGKTAVTLLLKNIDDYLPPQEVILNTEMIIRKSSKKV